MMMPTAEEIEAADHEQICRWYRFLPTPMNRENLEKLNRIIKRLSEFGGFTPEISKRIGWQE